MAMSNQPQSSQSGELAIDDLQEVFEALYSITPNYVNFGMKLNVPLSTISGIEMQYENSCDRLLQILHYRLKQLPPLTWHHIVQALRSPLLDQHDLARTIESQYITASQSPASVTQQASVDSGTKVSPMGQFLSFIKTTYRQSKSFNVFEWPPTPSEVFINFKLACVDWTTVVTKEEADECTRAMVEDGNVDVILRKKSNIAFDDIFRNLPATDFRKVILVEGAPGVGKSTFAWEFCRRWERGEIAQQYQLVLLLRLRDERMSRAQSLDDLIYHPQKVVCQTVEQELVDTNGINTLFILEGFDELPVACRNDSSIFMQLIEGKVLPKATVLVTSCPWATCMLHDALQHRIFQYIEILGFSENQIVEYVKSGVVRGGNENTDDVLLYLSSVPDIKICMYIPLMTAIVIHVYEESKAGNCIKPKTLTQLYYALTQVLLQRYLHGHPEYSKKKWQIRSLKRDLPAEVYRQLLDISKIAYNGICSDGGDSVQLVFSELPAEFKTLGLMQTVPQLYGNQKVNVSYNFLHITQLEFLAALHISVMSPERHLEHFQRSGELRLNKVLKFLAGLTTFPQEALKELLEGPVDKWAYNMKPAVAVVQTHISWMFQMQQDELIVDEKLIEFRGLDLLPIDYYYLGYCIAHSKSQWVLTIENSMKEEDVQMLTAAISTREETTARIICLRGNGSKVAGPSPLSISAEALNLLFKNLKILIDLKELCLQLCVDCSKVEWPTLLNLQHLHLERRFRGETHWKLAEVLQNLPLHYLAITDPTGTADMDFDDLEAVKNVLSSSVSLEYLHMQCIGDRGAAVLAQALQHSSSLKNFNLSGNVLIHEKGTHELVHALTVNTSILPAGLILPSRCNEYVIRSPHYKKISFKIKMLGSEEIDYEEYERRLDEALLEGHAKLGMEVLLLIGAGGSGKTHFKHLALGLDPPEERDSTGLSEDPIKTMSLVRGALEQTENIEDVEWTEVSSEKFLEMIAHEILKRRLIKKDIASSEHEDTVEANRAKEVHDKQSENSGTESDTPSDYDDSLTEDCSIPIDFRALMDTKVQIDKKEKHFIQSKAAESRLYQDILNALKSGGPSAKALLDVDWIYIVDSGGQPQYREMLPVLVKSATACVLTVKLNEPLDKRNEVEYVEKGKELCKPYQSQSSNQQVVKQCSQIVASQTKDCKLFLVGTHRDEEDQCKEESKMEKNKKLLELLEPQFGTNLQYMTSDQAIFPLDCKTKPIQQQDKDVMKDLRIAVTGIIRSKPKKIIPIHWLLLELLIHQLAGAKYGVLSYEVCKEKAKDVLKIEEVAFLAAVKFLAETVGTILYFPVVAPHIIFMPQAILTPLSELVKLHHILKDNIPAECKPRSGEWMEFLKCGILSESLLQTAPFKVKVFSDTYTVHNFVTILKELHIAAQMQEGDFYLPSVLAELSHNDIEKHTEDSCRCPEPLVLFYAGSTMIENWLPVSSFIRLVALLQNNHGWHLYKKGSTKPTCLYRNCIQFTLPDNQPGIVTLVDQLKHLEIYLNISELEVHSVCSYVHNVVKSGLEKVHKCENYSKDDITAALLCPKHKPQCHLASVRLERDPWKWTCKRDPSSSGELTAKQQPWFEGSEKGMNMIYLSL